MSSAAMSSRADLGAGTPVVARHGSGGGRISISWGAVFAGVVVALATAVLLSLIGVAIGAGPGILTAGVGAGAGIWAVLSTIVSMALGGYVAARLCGTYSHLDSELHGLTVWALTLLLGTVLVAQAVTGAIGLAVQGAGSAAGGALSGTGALASGLTQQMSPQALADRLQQSLNTGGDPTQMTKEQVTSEIAVLIGRRVFSGTLSDQDRDRLDTLVAVQAGVSKDEAARRVKGIEQDAQSFQAQAQKHLLDAADTASRAAAIGARAIGAALVLGLAAALLGAWFGTRQARVLAPARSAGAAASTSGDHADAGYHPAEDYAFAGQHPNYPSGLQERVIIHSDAGQRIAQHLQGLAFPASKQDVLSLIKARNLEPGMAAEFEQIADRPYYGVNDVLTALGLAH